MALQAAERKLIEEYLGWWGDARGFELAQVLAKAGEGPEHLNRAALAFTRLKQHLPISPVLAQNKAVINLILGHGADIVTRQIALGKDALPACLIHTDNMIMKLFVLPLMDNLVIRLRDETFPTEPQALWKYLEERVVTGTQVGAVKTIGDVTHRVLAGNTLLLVEGLDRAAEISTQGWDHRSPEEPIAEPVVRGPKEGFVETAVINLVLIRRRLLDERLRTEMFTIGSRTNTTVYLVYMVELAIPELVNEVRKRLSAIHVDNILESGVLEELMEDSAYTPFPLMKATERPDVVAGELLEGKVALVIDGTPHALVAPATFVGGMQAAEDYYQRWPMATFIRFLRFAFLFISLLGPSMYIAITTFHPEMLPTDLLLSLAVAREGVPFPAVIEAILMEISFEALREAGVRLPKTVGQTVSIVGALVIGEAAVRARLVSPVMVIVVAITGIASFVIPNYSTALAIRLLRFPMMMLAGTLGFFGLVIGLIALSIHLASLRSFGIPYMAPTMPPTPDDFKDMMIRMPWWAMKRRPRFMPMHDPKRQKQATIPKPPSSMS
ncbi:MAG TPA: spore germination protein [Symbiobacteriaceae bacterium]|nr:spore germination protein [Symbiobacteriaceae bacterium]